MAEEQQLLASGNQLSNCFDVDETSIINHIDEAFPTSAAESNRVQLVPVRTFVLHAGKDIRLSRGILVPSFASHWGVVVGKEREYMLYHLVLIEHQQPARKGRDTLAGKYKEVAFHWTQWNREDKGTMTEVGHTRFSYGEIIAIGMFSFLLSVSKSVGNKMVDEFGDYHRLFWNCQTFAKCFLQVLCGPQASAKFSSWTMAETSNMVLASCSCLSFRPCKHASKAVSFPAQLTVVFMCLCRGNAAGIHSKTCRSKENKGPSFYHPAGRGTKHSGPRRTIQ
jgi:hypothetical protein